jgi:phosphohistidine swiveling domain-containing protein
LGEDGSQTHFRLWGATTVAVGALEWTCRELLGWDDARSVELLAGTSHASTEPALALQPLVAAARRSADVGALLRDGASPEQVLAAAPIFARAYTDYQRRYGCRALIYDLGEPTLAERPEVILNLIRDQLGERPPGDPADARRTGDLALARARAALANVNEEARSRFEDTLLRARAAYALREDNEFYTISSPLALLRGIAQCIGARLVAGGQIDTVDDVFFLEVPEMLAALRAGGNHRNLIRRRRGERAWSLAHPGPPSYGTDPGPPPPLDGLPREALEVTQAARWAIERIAAPEANSRAHHRAARTLSGIGASPGRSRGPVRLIRDQHDFPKLRAGDVLVCPVASPVWSVLFANVAALVTDQGGTLSHTAIIAREFAIPAVVGTGDATRRLQEGQLVSVDGTTGTVHIISPEPADPPQRTAEPTETQNQTAGRPINLTISAIANRPV